MTDETPISIDPLDTLTFGRNHAWQSNIPALLAAKGIPPEADACVASWYIQAPWAHPVWHDYWLMVMHLRPLERDGEKFQDPQLYLEGATHELHVHALNPDHDTLTMARTGTPYRLTPVNFAAQLILPDDAAAERLARETALDVLEVRLNPDTDFLRVWATKFGDNMVKGGVL